MAQVSVVVPTYNQATYLTAALESVLCQSYDDFEVVVVNDGSTDNTEQVIRPYLDKIVYMRTNNEGLPCARNTAIELASGEYIAFLDSDDILNPCSLATRAQILDSRPEVGLVFADIHEFDDTGTLSTTFKRDYFDYANPVDSLFIADRIPVPTVMARKKCLLEAGLFDPTFHACEDWDMWLRVGLLSEVVFLDEVVARMRKHPASMSKNTRRQFTFTIRVMEKMLSGAYRLTQLQRARARAKIADVAGDFAHFLLSENDYRGASQRFLQEWQYSSTANPRPLVFWLAASLGRPGVATLEGVRSVARKLKPVR